LYEVPGNLAIPQEDEINTIKEFWNTEIAKCEFVKTRRVVMKEEYQAAETAKSIAAALAEAEKDKLESADAEKEIVEEEAYQSAILQMQLKVGLLTEEEFT